MESKNGTEKGGRGIKVRSNLGPRKNFDISISLKTNGKKFFTDRAQAALDRKRRDRSGTSKRFDKGRGKKSTATKNP